MAISIGTRPRSAMERLKLARALDGAPRRVGIGFADDGWCAACLRIAGKIPIWRARADRRPAEELLGRLGLPGLSHGEPEALLRRDLSLKGGGEAASAPLPPVDGPLVSIVICTYQRAGMVLGAVRSALAQTWPREVIVVDDGSTDDTRERLAGEKGIRLIVRPRNGGKPAALADGLAAARGEAVLVLDDDDLLLPGALHVLAPALFQAPERVAVAGDAVVFRHGDGRIQAWRPALRLPPAVMRRAVLQQVPSATGATLIRRSALDEAGGFDGRLARGEDMDLFLRLARLGDFEALPLPVFLLRAHGGLRGKAGDRWSKGDREEDRRRMLAYAAPVFRQRWLSLGAGAGREESHAWALGLFLRGLESEAIEELARWPAPHDEVECWIRSRLGLPAVPRAPGPPLLVVDDGDPGALQETLWRHARGHELWVDLEVPRDPLGAIQLHWPGHYGAHEALARWVTRPGPVELRVSSDPGWAPPPLEGIDLLPDLPAPDALRAVALVMDWPAPRSARPGLRRPEHPLVRILGRARCLLRGRRRGGGMNEVAAVLKAAPQWVGAWRLAAESFEHIGQAAEAARCRARAEEMRTRRKKGLQAPA